MYKQGYFDVDDVVIEALSRLNAPVWRRTRETNGFDYIMVDEMHLFNKNEQSVFHFLSKDRTKKTVPMCFALDYAQAIGDRGNTCNEYLEKEFNSPKKNNLKTVFRNSPQIADFCAGIAASGTLMFHESFVSPYIDGSRSIFTQQEEEKCEVPVLYMYSSDEKMVEGLSKRVLEIQKKYNFSPNKIAVIWFGGLDQSVVDNLNSSKLFQHSFHLMDRTQAFGERNDYVIVSPEDVNGLEFDAVILFGVDEGRVPEVIGTSDISKHFLTYSAFNKLYLSASRAKYSLTLLGSRLNGESSCLCHVIENNCLKQENK